MRLILLGCSRDVYFCFYLLEGQTGGRLWDGRSERFGCVSFVAKAVVNLLVALWSFCLFNIWGYSKELAKRECVYAVVFGLCRWWEPPPSRWKKHNWTAFVVYRKHQATEAKLTSWTLPVPLVPVLAVGQSHSPPAIKGICFETVPGYACQ